MKTYVNHISKVIRPVISDMMQDVSSSTPGDVNLNYSGVSKVEDGIELSATMSYGIQNLDISLQDFSDNCSSYTGEESKIDDPSSMYSYSDFGREGMSLDLFKEIYNQHSGIPFRENQTMFQFNLTPGNESHLTMFYELAKHGRWPCELKHIVIVYEKEREDQLELTTGISLRDQIKQFFLECIPQNLPKFTL